MSHAARIATALRDIAPDGKLQQAEIPHIDAIAALWESRSPAASVPAPTSGDPPWITVARSLIGQREIVGPQHNSWIANGWGALGARWFNDDETPWCGFFVAHCLQKAGLPYPGRGEFARALRWATWGTPCPRATLGAIGVKSRQGGGHVFFIVGETPDRTHYKALGGNQKNMVSIVDIPKSVVTAIRWPQGAAPTQCPPLPVLPPGTVSGSEA